MTVASDAFFRSLVGRDAVSRPPLSPSSRVSMAAGSIGGGGGGGGGEAGTRPTPHPTILVAERGVLPMDADRRTRSKGAASSGGGAAASAAATSAAAAPSIAAAAAAPPMEAHDPTAKVVTAEEALEALRQSGSIRRAAKVFYSLDDDHDGRLAAPQLRAALAAQKLVLSPKEVGRLMHMVDDNDDGVVEINEFLQHCHASVGVRPPRASALAEPGAGVSSDGNDRAALAAAAVREAVRAITSEWPELAEALPRRNARVVGLFEALDRDQDRFVSRDDLRQYLRGRVLAALPPDRLPAPALDATLRDRAASGFGLVPPVRGAPRTMDPSAPALATAALPFDAAVERLVELADTNHDGHLDASDLVVLADALHDDAPPRSKSAAAGASGGGGALARSGSLPYLGGTRVGARWHPAVLAAHGGVAPNAGVGTLDTDGGDGIELPAASPLAATATAAAARVFADPAAARHRTAHGTAIPIGGGVSGATSRLRARTFHGTDRPLCTLPHHTRVATRTTHLAAAPVPYWMEYTDDVVVPAPDAPSYATSSDRFRTTSGEAAAAGCVFMARLQVTSPTCPHATTPRHYLCRLSEAAVAARSAYRQAVAAAAVERKAQRLARVTEPYFVDHERLEARYVAPFRAALCLCE